MTTLDDRITQLVKDCQALNHEPSAVVLSPTAYKEALKRAKHNAYRAGKPEPSKLTSIETKIGPLPVVVVRDPTMWEAILEVGVQWQSTIESGVDG